MSVTVVYRSAADLNRAEYWYEEGPKLRIEVEKLRFDLGCDYCDNCHDQDESVCWADFYIMQAQKEEDRSADCDI